MKLPQVSIKLIHNARFYILCSSVLLSIVVVCGLRLYIPSDQLFYIRTQQIYGLIAAVLIYIAIILTPLSKIIDKKHLSGMLFARRAIGVSAAYFSLIHTIIAVVDQTGGLSGLQLLPERFKLSFILGTVALLILILMAVTSFDKAITFLTFKKWKILHRFVYLAIGLIVVHVWLIGTHADDTMVRVITAAALAVLFGLEAFRLGIAIADKRHLSQLTRIIVSVALFAGMIGSLTVLPLLSQNYHSDHHDGSHPGGSE